MEYDRFALYPSSDTGNSRCRMFKKWKLRACGLGQVLLEHTDSFASSRVMSLVTGESCPVAR
jgi:hypothetical protein